MNEFLDIAAPLAAAVALGTAAGFAAFFILRKQRTNRIQSPEDDDEVFINIALCETRHGIKTHYHDIGSEALNYGGYPVGKDHPTLCGVETGWDMNNQDVEATCVSCLEALAKYAREFDDA